MKTHSHPNDAFSMKYSLYGSMLFKIAMVHLGNKSDAEEAVQEAFMKLLYKAPEFVDLEHEKAWVIRVLINICKNVSGSLWRRRVVHTEQIEAYCSSAADAELIECVLRLPFKYKAAIHLFYYEDYSVKQIAEALRISESAVKMRLARGREMLRFEMEEA
ncbi:RNA polymerase sigma factor [Paenibacillus spongiae]|uniref:Sigma-70 family RNA polymerase sigma factor n=1 Tax=Paenibacillus spongiae TaxID=2909671 RepID=A0ABY5S7E1_9BACL|nr:sigma-70 family RNA polymerase sigma factor [Paenibacillus spongiae]UVI29423.1 sigma-70 family RNA polymerase sigma factor [Paenibacillus spongiae]